MNETIKKAGAAAASACLLGSAALAATPANVEFVTPGDGSGIAYAAQDNQSVSADELDGQFAYAQNEVTSNAVIKRVFLKVSTVCANMPSYLVEGLSPKISVGGDVEKPVVATLDELAENSDVVRMIMACACATNGVNGDAVVNADVSGVLVEDIAKIAGVR